MDTQNEVLNDNPEQIDLDAEKSTTSSLDSEITMREILNLSNIDPGLYSPCYELTRSGIHEYVTLVIYG